jgi:hypothetical protein
VFGNEGVVPPELCGDLPRAAPHDAIAHPAQTEYPQVVELTIGGLSAERCALDPA